MKDRAHQRNEAGLAGPRFRARPLPEDSAREQMMRREARLPVEARITLFEALSRDAAWAQGARRVR